MIYRVQNPDSWKTHYARARREDLARTLPPEDVTAENWFHWRSVCGRDLIGLALPDDDDLPVTCDQCLSIFERDRRRYAELVERWGPGDVPHGG